METTTEPQQSKFNKKMITVLVLICVIAGSAAWYFMYFTKTPEYSLNLVRESIEKRDLEKFKKQVDIDSVLSRGYDDLIAATLENDPNMNETKKKMASGFAQMFKGAAVNMMKDGVTRFVETGDWNKPEDASEQQANQPKVDAKGMMERAGIQKSTFKGIAYSKKDGASANVGIKLFDQTANKEVVLDLKMRRLDDGTWQIAEVTNLKEYFAELQKIKQAK